MRIVIDSNRMQSDELRAFLSLSSDNIAVLTDYAAMEAFQGNSLVSIQASWTVLRDFPRQVLVLKGTRAAALVDPRAPGMGKRLVSKSETKAVADFAALLDRAATGNRSVQTQLLQRGRWADDHMQSMLSKAGDMNLSISEFSAFFTEPELKRMRKNEPWKPETGTKFLELVDHLTVNSFEALPDKPKWPNDKNLVDHFLYRHTLTYVVYMTRLIQRGAVTRKAKFARNDAVDVIFATYATFFNGLMTADDEASAIHHIARGMLKQIGARLPEDYMEPYFRIIADEMDDGLTSH
ncbi:hypothetical protein [Sphingopyxis panaciterrae]